MVDSTDQASLASTRISASGACSSHDPHPFQVARTAHLDLEGVVAGGTAGAIGGALQRVDADRVGGGGATGSSPYRRQTGSPQTLPSEVVQGAVERALGSHRPGSFMIRPVSPPAHGSSPSSGAARWKKSIADWQLSP